MQHIFSKNAFFLHLRGGTDAFNHLKWISFSFLFGFLASFAEASDPSLTAKAKKAEKLFYEKMYGDALPLYAQLRDFFSEPELKTQFTLRLAYCHLQEKQPNTALKLLSSLESPLYHNTSLLLRSLAHRQLKDAPPALQLLQQCSFLKNQNAKDLIALEKGYHFMQIGNFTDARFVLASIPWEANNSSAYHLAQLQLAKISLVCHEPNEALERLSLLSLHLPTSNLLNIERIYLKAYAFSALKQDSQAAACFEELLPKALTSKEDWSTEVLGGFIISSLRKALASDFAEQKKLTTLFSKIEEVLQHLLVRLAIDKANLLFIDVYLIKAKCFNDPHSYAAAQQLFNQINFSSQEQLKETILKFAGAAPSYEERRRLYAELSKQSSPSFCAITSLMKGLNDFEEGVKHQREQRFSPNFEPFEEAAKAFIQTIQITEALHPEHAALARKYLVLTHLQSGRDLEAWKTIHQLIESDDFLSTFSCPEEMYCLSAWIALRLADPNLLQQAKLLLQEQKSGKTYTAPWKERLFKLEGFICLQLKQWQEADKIFSTLLEDKALSSSHSEAWFWKAYSAEQQQSLSLKKEYLQKAYSENPKGLYAPIAYFHLYSYREYMQGSRKAIKHLHAMPLLFPHHPLLITAYYLIGLNHRKDHLSNEGQILRRKDWTAAIDAFQMAESTFDDLFAKNLIPSPDLKYFVQIRYQSQLERAQANFSIGQSSSGGKRQIYLEYAEQVFTQLIQDFHDSSKLANQALLQPSTPYPKIWAQAEFQLAKIFQEKNEWKKAEFTLNESLEHYRQAQMTQGLEFMRTWYTKGCVAQRQADNEAALQYFLEAEKAMQGTVGISPNEKLDLWIQQSLCYKALNQLDQAMQLFSKVINEDAISPLRIKAMFLRAEVYEAQGRPELAIKQLEAAARKGGEWAQKSKEKLEQIYGYSFYSDNHPR